MIDVPVTCAVRRRHNILKSQPDFRGHIDMRVDCRLVLLAVVVIGCGLMSFVAASDDPASQYNVFRQESVASKAPQIMPGFSMQRADAMAKRAEALQKANRNAEAARLYREAQWLLPVLPPDPPQYLSHIFGNARLRHAGWVSSVAFGRDGRYLASASADGSVRVWDLACGHRPHQVLCR